VDVAKKYVTAGVGIALMYVTEEAARGTPGLHVRPLEADVERLSIEMAVRKATHLPDYVEDFRRIVRSLLKSVWRAPAHWPRVSIFVEKSMTAVSPPPPDRQVGV
jgi:hypothetical protein